MEIITFFVGAAIGFVVARMTVKRPKPTTEGRHGNSERDVHRKE